MSNNIDNNTNKIEYDRTFTGDIVYSLSHCNDDYVFKTSDFNEVIAKCKAQKISLSYKKVLDDYGDLDYYHLTPVTYSINPFFTSANPFYNGTDIIPPVQECMIMDEDEIPPYYKTERKQPPIRKRKKKEKVTQM